MVNQIIGTIPTIVATGVVGKVAMSVTGSKRKKKRRK